VIGGNGIPLVDLGIQHSEIAAEIDAGWKRVVDRSAFIQGRDVAEFETAFSEFCGVRHCVGVANGTDALELALRAIGLEPGHEVVLPVNSFIASALAVVRIGAKPVLVDTDPRSHLMNMDLAREAVTPRTRAVMPVHLFGQIAEMESLEGLPEAASIVEDAAQAQGASRHGTKIGNFGLVAGTSFYPGKNLGAYGDAGAVLTNSDEVAHRVRLLGNHGSEEKYVHHEIGFNSRLDTLQAVVLMAKLRRLDKWNEARRRAAAIYDRLLREIPDVEPPSTLGGNEHVWHLYVVRVPARDRVIKNLHAAGIGAGVHYPTPIHLHDAMRSLGHDEGDFPVAERAALQILSLPIYPGITEAQQERVVIELERALA
jgi:dTDP-4-amino-4,6-dideoxygalactose transaminase